MASPEQAPEHLEQFVKHRIDVQWPAPHHLTAAERQKLAGEARRALGLLFQVLQAGLGGRVQVLFLQQKTELHEDRRQDVVEVVGHTARQLAHRLHLARLHEFLRAFGDSALQPLVFLSQGRRAQPEDGEGQDGRPQSPRHV